MRSCCVIITLFMTAGCASNSQRRMSRSARYHDAAASSLVFTPPVALGEEPLELARNDRTPQAFVGYDEISTSYFHIWTDDRQTNDGTDRYVRRSTIEKVGVSYR
jgi:hypothetical protein